MKIPRMEVSFFRRKSKQVGKAQLYCRISVGGERVNIGSTGHIIGWDHWDGDRVTKLESGYYHMNEHLDIMRDQLRAHYSDLFRKKEKITATKIKRLYEGQTGTGSLLSAFELYMKDSKTDPERNLTKSTLTVYENVRKN